MPPNAKFYNYPKLKRTLKKRRRLLARNSTDKSTGPLDYCTGVNSLECGRRRTNTETNNQLSLNAPKAPRAPLHRQPEFLAFLANPRATLLTSMAPPGVHKVPRKVGNNLNNTVRWWRRSWFSAHLQAKMLQNIVFQLMTLRWKLDYRHTEKCYVTASETSAFPGEMTRRI